jgi:uncharacterized protein YlxP (DUF503 family)
MNVEQYSVIPDNSNLSFKFQSIGPKGVIKKRVLFRKIISSNENYYNLSFGDWDEQRGRADDLAITNNNDTDKVLSTVANTILKFVQHFPDSNILIIGSTKSRTRLYQMAIRRNIVEIENLFYLQGLRNGIWELYKPGINFDAFLIKCKEIKL